MNEELRALRQKCEEKREALAAAANAFLEDASDENMLAFEKAAEEEWLAALELFNNQEWWKYVSPEE
jgi:hypothetical protein